MKAELRFIFYCLSLLSKLAVIPAFQTVSQSVYSVIPWLDHGIQKKFVVNNWIPVFTGMTANAISNLKMVLRRNILSKLDTYDCLCEKIFYS